MATTAPMSLNGFYSACLTLLEKSHAEFVDFALTGMYENEQAVVDPILDSMPDEEDFEVLRDYDSLIGIDKNIGISCPLNVYPVAQLKDTLRKNIHLSYRFSCDSDDLTAPIHKIPNLCLGNWAPRNTILILFPGLHPAAHPSLDSPTRSTQMTQDEMTEFYELGLRPAVVQLLGSQADEWPPKYDSEMFRDQGKNGGLQLQSKMLPEWHMPYLGDAIRGCLEENGCLWAS
ncbi:hypothetical protein H0H81_006306, partial [Sphagnurus paluster]